MDIVILIIIFTLIGLVIGYSIPARRQQKQLLSRNLPRQDPVLPQDPSCLEEEANTFNPWRI